MTMVPAQTVSKQPQQQQQQQHSNLYSAGGTCGGLVHNIINQDATLPLIFGPRTDIHHIINHNNNNNKNNKFGFLEEAAAAGYDQYLYYNNSIGEGGGGSISNHLSRVVIGAEGLVSMADEEDSATISTNETGSTSNNTASKAQPPPPPNRNNELDAGEGGGWLRLGIGGSSTTDAHHNNNNNNNRHLSDHPQQEVAGSMLELNLLPGGTTASTTASLLLQHQQAATRAAAFLPPPPPPPIFTGPPSAAGFSPAVPILFYQSHHHHQLQQPDQLGWANYLSRAQGATINPRVLSVASSSSSSSSLMQYATAAQSFLQPRPSRSPFQLASSGGASDVIRVVDPPPRPHSGIWLMLLPSLSQAKEPFLPQLARNYLRIKDGKMTVGLLIKYLVNKLGLESESEVEIRCRDQELEGNLTIQQVRDEIWSGREAEMMTLLPHSSTADHVMVIHYARSSSSSNYT